MDKKADPGVYIWIGTTHKRGKEEEIIRSLYTALAGDSRTFKLGLRVGTGSTASDDLIRSVFVLYLDEEVLSARTTSSPVRMTLLANIKGAVNGATGDPERSNCMPCILPYPPEKVIWKTVEKGEVTGEPYTMTGRPYYLILGRSSEEEIWNYLGEGEASSPEEAARKYLRGIIIPEEYDLKIFCIEHTESGEPAFYTGSDLQFET